MSSGSRTSCGRTGYVGRGDAAFLVALKDNFRADPEAKVAKRLPSVVRQLVKRERKTVSFRIDLTKAEFIDADDLSCFVAHRDYQEMPMVRTVAQAISGGWESLCARRHTPRHQGATAHQLARFIYAMLTLGEEYVENGIEGFECERRDRQLRHLRRQTRRFNLARADVEQAA